jgi:hypothetical protein
VIRMANASGSPKQSNIQGTGIITGDINLSFSSIKDNQHKLCYACKCVIDNETIGGRYLYLKDGRKFMFCDWCLMCLEEHYEKVKEYL